MNNKTLLLTLAALLFGSMLLFQKCKPDKKCLPDFVHTPYSDSLLADGIRISLQEANEYVNRLIAYKNAVRAGQIKDSLSSKCPLAESVSSDKIYNLINKPNIIGVRSFFGLNKLNHLVIIHAGLKPDGHLDIEAFIEKMRPSPIINDGDTTTPVLAPIDLETYPN